MSHKKALLSIGRSEAVAKLLSWLTLALLPIFVSSSEYGAVVLAYSFLMFLFPLVLIGQDRKILSTDEDEGGVNVELVASLQAVLIVGLSLGLFFLLALALFDIGPLYLLVPFAAIALSVNKLQLCAFRTKNQFNNYSSNRIMYSSIRFVGILSTAHFGGVAAYLFSELFSAIIVSQRVLRTFFSGTSWPRGIKNRVIEGVPLAVHGVSGTLLALSDRVIIERYHTLSDVGEYAFAYMVASAVFFVYAVFGILYEPKIYKSKTVRDVKTASTTCLYRMLIAGIPFSMLAFLAYFLSSFILQDYQHDYNIYSVLALAHIVMPVYYVANYVVVRFNKARLLLGATLVSASLNILLNLMFVPTFGSLGAAVTTLISNIFLSAVLAIFAINQYKKELP